MPSVVTPDEYMFYWIVGLGFLGFLVIATAINFFRDK